MISKYYTSRTATLVLFIILLSVLIYIMTHRPYGTLLWFLITSTFIFFGFRISRKRSPETASRIETNTVMDIVFALNEMSHEVNVVFRRPKEYDTAAHNGNTVYVIFYSPRLEKPERAADPRQFWIAYQPRTSLYNMIYGILTTLRYELSSFKKIIIHFGWPMSSLLDRLSISTLIYNLMRLPKKFPELSFRMNYYNKLNVPAEIQT